MNLERETDGRLVNWCLRDRETDPIQSDVITEKHTQKMNMNETRVKLEPNTQTLVFSDHQNLLFHILIFTYIHTLINKHRG